MLSLLSKLRLFLVPMLCSAVAACQPGVVDDREPGDAAVVDPCEPDPCNGHGTCVSEDGAAVCTCSEHFDGPTCATCVAGYSGVTCTECASGYFEYPVGTGLCVDDPCEPDPCDGLAICTRTTGAAVCTCRNHCYYVSASTGDDAHTAEEAQDPNTPWRSLAKLSLFSAGLEPGDSVLLKRGDTFYESLEIAASGSADSPIFVGGYGPGPKPELSGFVSPTTWTPENGSIAWTAFDCSSSPEMVVVDGVQQGIGRWPNDGTWMYYEAHSGRTSLTDNELTGTPDWTGAELVMRVNDWAISRNEITGHSGTTLQFVNSMTSTDEIYDLKDGWGYFIQNDLDTLDSFGEWFCDKASSKLYVHFGGSAPESHSVLVTALDELVTLAPNVDHVIFDGLAVMGANNAGMNCSSDDFITVQNTTISFSGNFGVRASGCKSLSILDTSIANSNDKGILAGSSSHGLVIRGCTILDTGTIAGLGLTSTQSHIGIYAAYNDNAVIEQNQILRSGYSGINFNSNNGFVRNNLIDTFCFNMVDGGGVYYGGQTSGHNMTITGNIVRNGLGAPGGEPVGTALHAANGIYVDYNTLNGVKIVGNTVENCVGGGIFIHESQNIEITDNTVYNSLQAMRFQDSGLGVGVRGITMSGNVFFAKSDAQVTMWARTSDSSNDFDQWGTFSDNYYARPIGDPHTIVGMVDAWTDARLTLEEWRALSGQDADSHVAPITIPTYTVDGFLSANLFANGSFDANVSGVSCWNDVGNCTLSWDSGVLDGGALKVSFDARVPTTTTLITIPVGTITSGKSYILEHTSKGDAGLDSKLEVYLRKLTSPWTHLSAGAYAPVTAARLEHEALLPARASEVESAIIFELGASDSTSHELWLDNIALRDAAVALTDPDDHFLFEANPSLEPMTLPLVGTYLDVFGNAYTGSVAIPAYGSVVLIRE